MEENVKHFNVISLGSDQHLSQVQDDQHLGPVLDFKIDHRLLGLVQHHDDFPLLDKDQEFQHKDPFHLQVKGQELKYRHQEGHDHNIPFLQKISLPS